ncbi:MAG TPA: VanZ family protein [Bacteroidales bacterium]|nr:VanZ family protein [Bacteroidales bacterium]
MKDVSFFRRNLPGIFWTVLILVLMGIPGNRFPEIKSFWEWLITDKLIHLFLFGVWAYLIIRQNKTQYISNPRRFLINTLIAGAILSALAEILQEFVFVNRSGDFYDWMANMAGMIFGITLYVVVHRKKSG